MSENQEENQDERLQSTNDAAQGPSAAEMQTDASNAQTSAASHSQRNVNGHSKKEKLKIEFKGNCHNCGQKGHKARTCKEPYNRNQARRRCYQCGKPGHIAKQCPNRKSGPAGLNTILTNCRNCTFNLTTNLPKEN